MSGGRDVLVFGVVGLLLGATLLGQVMIAEVRHEQTTYHYVAKPVTSTDWDGDGIPDSLDRCPARPETYNGFQDQDGCPDTVTTTRTS